MYRLVFLAAALLLLSRAAQADVLLNETFDDVSNLASSGWVLSNLSAPRGTTDWFQGDSTILTAHAGAPESYIAANFRGAAEGGLLDEWLVSPAFSTASSGTIAFWLRSAAGPGFIDRVAFGFAPGGGAATTGFADMTTAVASGDWIEYSLAYSARGADSLGRFALNYAGSADGAEYVGIDTFTVISAVPEASSAFMLTAGGVGLAAWLRRRRPGAAAR